MGYIGPKPADAALTSADISDGIITAAKLATNAVETAKVKDLNVTVAKLPAAVDISTKTVTLPASVSGLGTGLTNSQLVNNAVTFNGITVALGASGTIPTGEGDLPTISTSSLIAEPTTDTTLTINGTNYVSIPKIELVKTTGAITTAPTVTFDSATQLRFTTGTGLSAGTFYIRVINPDGGTVTTSSAILNISAAPAWVTGAGSLGSVAGGGSVNFTVDATDATSYAKQSGTFPGGVTINSSTGVISGTETGSSATTVYTFTIRATDAEAQTSDREFSITITHGLEQGMAFV